MRVLVGCERSSTVASAFRSVGVDAWSCDILPCYGDIPDFHILGDVREVYNSFKPDLFIAHPPCTYLAHSGSCRLVNSSGMVDSRRYELGLFARAFFLWCLSRPCLVCVENPIPSPRYELPKYTQIVQPWYFGDKYTKATCLWLRGLPPLHMTNPVKPVGSWCDIHRSPTMRSKTFPGLALAMAHQWSGELENLQFDMGVF